MKIRRWRHFRRGNGEEEGNGKDEEKKMLGSGMG